MRCVVATVVVVSALIPLNAQGPEKKQEPVTLTGCVGEGLDRGTYYVADMTRTPYDGMSIGVEPNAIFALDSPAKLKKFVNNRVEIRGVVEQNKDTKGRVDAQADAVSIDADGQRRTRIPGDTDAAKAAASGGVAVARTSYKVKVKEVVLIPGTEGCIKKT